MGRTHSTYYYKLLSPSKLSGLRRTGAGLLAAAALGCSAAVSPSAIAASAAPRAAFALSHMPLAVRSSPALGLTPLGQTIDLEFALKPRNADQIPVLLARLKDPKDSLYGHFLTPADYKAQFSPTDSQVSQVVAYAKAHNFTVLEVKPNNLYVRCQASVADVNAAFGVTLRNYSSNDPVHLGRVFHAPNTEPTIDSAIAPLLTGIFGIENAGAPHTGFRAGHPTAPPKNISFTAALMATPMTSSQQPAPYYTGADGFSPRDTSNIYGMSSIVYASSNPIKGKGQTIGLAEIGSYTLSDIRTWEDGYNLPEVSIHNYGVDGYDTNSIPGDPGETTLDFALVQTWAYGCAGIQDYEGPTDSSEAFPQELADIFSAMANASTLPNVISVSYGAPEIDLSESDVYAEGEALDQLALQGQTVCVASGDSAAWVDQSTDNPNVADPESQPTVLSVGGTQLVDNLNEDSSGDYYVSYKSESSWYDPNDTGRGNLGTGGGGGVSAYWAIPSWQKNAFSTSTNTQGSTTARNVPDVSAWGDYDDLYDDGEGDGGEDGGYSMYLTEYDKNGNITQQSWTSNNGTSAACPLWAGFLACVNQERASAGVPLLGQANQDVYAVAESSRYSTDFHDVKDGSTNGYYKTVTGYDNSTGWGSPNNGADLVADIADAPTYRNWGLSASASSVTAGKTLTGEINTVLPVTKNDSFTLTSSNTNDFTVPSSVTVDKGKNSATFTITAKSVSSSAKATLKAVYYGAAESVSITVNPSSSSSPSLSALSLSPTSIASGKTSTGTVTLSSAAPSSGTVVTLKSSDTADATVPSSVTVASGKTTATFTVTAKTVTKNTSCTITATNGSVSKTATLSITTSSSSTPSLSALSLSPTTVIDGKTSTGTVTLSSAAPSSGTVVTLKSSDTADATVPSSVTVGSGKTTATFTVTSKTVSKNTSCTITATYGSVSKTASLAIDLAGSATATKLSLSPSTVTGGNSSTGTVTISAAAPSSGTVVTLSTSNSSSTNLPSSVTVASGKTSATFTIKTASVFSNTSVTISAAAGGTTQKATLTVDE